MNLINFERDTRDVVFSSSDQQQRVIFEIDWLSGLIDTTQRFIDDLPGSTVPSSSECTIKFLVTLPLDRFAELYSGDREAFRLRHKHVEIGGVDRN